VVAQSADTAATRTVSSNQQGEYSVPALLPGPYNITIEANGFKTVHQNGVVVEVDQRARLDFALTIGSNSESITVQESAPLLNTSDASVSTLIGNRFVENLPLNGRSFSSLIDLTPGVVLTPTNFYEQGQFSVNGQRPDANYFLVDGVSANLGTADSGLTLGQGGAGQLPERLSLQARADFFNIFNHPNFGSPINYLSSSLFGQSTQMLGASLGSGGQNGGLNPLYQIGGPRSAQLALKLLF
jgi:hypothetical protein